MRKKVFCTQEYRLDYSGKNYILGILNITPDSFSDGGKYQNLNHAVECALQMIEDGADIIDIGGESTRPQALTIPPAEEASRIIPIVKKIREHSNTLISVDTRKSSVAREALKSGANIVNDVSGLKYDRDMAQIIAQYKAGCILMHMRGVPATMQGLTTYENLIDDISAELQASVDIALSEDILPEQIILDPGIGFSKDVTQNLQILNNLEAFHQLGFPLLIGTSRKSFIAKTLKKSTPTDCLWGTAATTTFSFLKGARFFRVHDVKQMKDVLDMTQAIVESTQS